MRHHRRGPGFVLLSGAKTRRILSSAVAPRVCPCSPPCARARWTIAELISTGPIPLPLFSFPFLLYPPSFSSRHCSLHHLSPFVSDPAVSLAGLAEAREVINHRAINNQYFSSNVYRVRFKCLVKTNLRPRASWTARPFCPSSGSDVATPSAS